MSNEQIQVTFVGGPDESVDPRQLPPGTVTSVRNVVYDQNGSYQPRLGYTALSGGTTNPAQALALYTAGQELLANDGTSLWTWSPQASNWAARDTIPDVSATETPLINATSSYLAWGEAVYQNYRVVAWIDFDFHPRVAVYDIETDACVYGPVATTDSAPYTVLSVGIVGSTAILVGARNSTAVYAATLALAPLGTLGAFTQVDNSDLSGAYNVAYMSTTFAVIYEASVTGTQSKLVLRSFNTALALQVANSFTFTNGTHGFIAIAARGTPGENLWIAANANTASAYATKALVLRADSTTLAVTAGPFAMGLSNSIANFPSGFTSVKAAGIERLNSTTCLAVFDLESIDANGRIFGAINWQTFNTSGAVSAASGATNVVLASTPVFDSVAGKPVALVAVPGSNGVRNARQMVAGTPTTFSIPFNVPGSYALAAFGTSTSFGSGLVDSLDLWGVLTPQIVYSASVIALRPTLVSTSPGVYETVAPVSRSTKRLGLNLFAFTHGEHGQRIGANLGAEMYVGGMFYDGTRVVENGFVHPPMPFTATDQSGSPTNTFQYCATFLRVDSQGNAEESAPSAVIYEVSSATPNVSLVLSPIHLTRKQREPGDSMTPGGASRIYVLIYRTPALENGDNTLYLLTALPYPSANLNSLLTDTITISDSGVADATLTTHSVLYTVGGELQHDAPEMLHGVITHNNRVWGIGADGIRVWYSQTYVAGVTPSWSLIAAFTVDDASESITALADLYSGLLVFTERRIYVLYGDGGAVSGAGSSLQAPQRVPSASGCTQPRSVVSTPIGVMFVSERGIEVITPGLDVQFIGLPVSVTTSSFPICASATLDDRTSTVRFCMTTSDTLPSQAGGVLLVYDLRRNRWTMHYLTPGGEVGALPVIPLINSSISPPGAPVYASTYHPVFGFVEGHNLNQYSNILTENAVIARENTTSDVNPWLDYGTVFVPIRVVLAWIKSGDLQGWQTVRRIRILSESHDVAVLSIGVEYDYTSGFIDAYSFEFNATQNPLSHNVIEDQPLQVMVRPSQGRCEALRLALSTTALGTSAGTGQGLGLVGAAFEILMKRGGYRRVIPGLKG